MSSCTAEFLASAGRQYVRHGPGSLGKPWLAAKYLNPYLRDCPRRCIVRTRFGADVAVDTQDLIQRYIYMFGTWEPHMTRWLSRRLRHGDTFVDVGANIGYFSLLAARLVGSSGRVVAIEASPAFHRSVLANLQRNACPNVRAVNTAVSDAEGALRFTLASSHNMGANSIVPYDGPAESSFEAQALPLTGLLTAAEIATARVIKVDVEGAEGSVVRGMVPLLDQLRPDVEVTVEVTPERMARLGDSVEELLAIMRDYGFHAYRQPNDYAPESYPAALRHAGAPLARVRETVVEESDLVFSHVDADVLP
ncbi:FkbM family methyltransferase [Streptomyces roseoverticillatus]|uniref:FkbM family methyltransferase n=1 Tax=Streptomyces roseoverticillatus TaxID=66429 RepID=UPI001EEDC84C|nr:FkbM family methyltransferase [Streptomyces roseoverticillatus]MCF3102928.1 FkbM family methyltransferase [Streptomyces roseoverticillatus]